MHSSPVSRLLHAFMGVLFAFNFAQPVWMSGMDMSSMDMDSTHCEAMAAESQAHVMHGGASESAVANHVSHDGNSGESAPSNKDAECKQHECCASALVHASLSPIAALSWLPEHVISQETPESIDCVVDTDVQLKLPFANGPPMAVIS